MPIEKAPRQFNTGDIVVSTFANNFIERGHAGIVVHPEIIVNSDKSESIFVVDVTYQSPNTRDKAKIVNNKWILDPHAGGPFSINFKGFPGSKEMDHDFEFLRRSVASYAARFVGRYYCVYSRRRYKPDVSLIVALNPETPDDMLSFTCAGFVEYIFEQSEFDLIQDDSPDDDLPNDQNRLYPWYLLAALDERVNQDEIFPFKILPELHLRLADNNSDLARYYALPDETR